jgi:putative addiction module component (TIGR02574 family)
MTGAIKEILALSVEERLEIIDQIWESLTPSEIDHVPLTKAQEAELSRRIELYQSGELKTFSWEEVKQRVRNEL